jgi:hypothetical protein
MRVKAFCMSACLQRLTGLGSQLLAGDASDFPIEIGIPFEAAMSKNPQLSEHQDPNARSFTPQCRMVSQISTG